MNTATGDQTGNSRAMSWFLLAAIAVLLFVLFHLQGNTADVPRFSRSVFGWMIDRWSVATLFAGDYSHGWLIPLVSFYALWRKRREIQSSPKAVSWPAIWIVLCALVLHWVGARAQQPRISLMSLVILLWGITFLLYGWRTARLIIFPCFYLVFCIPMNFFDVLTFPLRILATAVSSSVLNGLGIAVERSGSAIYSVPRGLFSLEVADPCSGIRSLLAMTALTVAYAYFTQPKFWKQIVLFLSAVPLAIVANVIRIVTIAIVAAVFGQPKAMHIYHDCSGYIVFISATILMIAIGQFLNIDFRSRAEKWFRKTQSPISS